MKKYSENIQNRFTARHKKCINICGQVKGKRILDIGCYVGWFQREMLKRGTKEVIGIDVSQKFLEKAKVNVPGVKFVKMSALELNFPTNSFDLVTIFDVLEHLPREKENKVFSRIYKILRPKGKLIISVPNYHFFANLFDPAWYIGHRHYSLRKLTYLLNKSGFLVEKSEIKGGIISILSMIFLYFFKFIFNAEIPFKEYVDKLKCKEYRENRKGIMTIFVVARKNQVN